MTKHKIENRIKKIEDTIKNNTAIPNWLLSELKVELIDLKTLLANKLS